MSSQQKSVTNYLCLSLKGEFSNTLGGCIERMHEGSCGRERERERWHGLEVVEQGTALVSLRLCLFCAFGLLSELTYIFCFANVKKK